MPPLGMRGIRDRLAGYLETHLPDFIAAVAVANGDELPAPLLYLPHPPAVVDRSPMIAVSGLRMKGLTRLENKPGAVEYLTTYVTRTFVWILADGQDDATDVRDDLTVALRTLLLDRQTLDFGDVHAVIDEDTLLEEYSDVEATGKGERYIAGAYVECELTLVETVERAADGTVDDVEMLVTPHPAL